MKTIPLGSHRTPARSGVALLITLLFLALITIIAVAFLGTMTWEMSAAKRNYENQKARALAMLGMNTAVAQLRQALGPWDNPYQNFATNPPSFYWSVSPGILTRWSYTNVAPLTTYPLFSIDPNGATNLVNLNAAQSDGTYPIAGGANAPNISVYWANVLKNPASTTASAANPIVGRYAFWVDDENAKININTADGTLKYTTNSVGLGTPSEVSLQVLQQAEANLSTQMATNIVYLARTTGFNSVREILRATNATSDIYTNNVFNLTTCGRSPELNLFGEPKINLIPASIPPSSPDQQGYLQTNDITLQPLTEIYPTPYQLPPYLSTNACYPWLNTEKNPMQPEVTTQEWAALGNGGGLYTTGYFYTSQEYTADSEGYMMDNISRYLGGTNTMNTAIQWPVFPYPSAPLATTASSGTNGFVGKYSLRQLDALAVQMTDVVGKAITPEAVSDWGNQPPTSPSPLTIPSCKGGLLSLQLVPGLGRSPRINEIAIEATTIGGVPSTGNPPYLIMNIYLETYLPAGFAGVDLLNINNGLPPAGSMESSNPLGNIGVWELGGGPGSYTGSLNLEDQPSAVRSGANPSPVDPTNYAFIPRAPPQPYAGSPSNQTNDYWSDTLLQNNAGIDFSGNGTSALDPDQIRADAYHQGITPSTYAMGQYPGAGPTPYPTPLLEMAFLSQYNYNQSGRTVWYPGQYRTVVNQYNGVQFPMMTNTPSINNVLTFSGGLIVNGVVTPVTVNDPVMTPFESSVRGYPGTGAYTQIGPTTFIPGGGNNWDGEAITISGAPSSISSGLAWINPRLPTAPGNPAQTTYSTTELLRDRVMEGVIPVNFSAPIPLPSASAGGPVDVTWYHAEVADPLVNEFAGDWITATNSNNTMGVGNGFPPAISANAGGNGGAGFAFYYNGQNVSATGPTANSPYYDPDSFWLPTLDPQIPRSARMPNIGYLNYQRTGVIPDDETVPVNQQHGTPYRCLNFNAVNDPSQMGAVTPYRATGYYYPDWALLDLFTVPSTLLPYHGPYGYYANGVWQAGSIMTGNPTNMYNYGTWGGSTPGRINPNGSVIYTTNMTTPTPGITRTLPLQGVLYGLKINQTLISGTGSGTGAYAPSTNAPTTSSYTGGTTLDSTGSANIASAIATYIDTYGPLREPAEICNIPAISAYAAIPSAPGGDANHNNPTRNDLVRQIVGNLTTQSNTFSVWVAGESISKTKGNTNYGVYESGDQVSASVRYHFIVERDLEIGADGVIGNSTLPTGSPPTGDIDRLVGTYDDPVDTNYHPPHPRYLYRIVYAEEIRD